MIRTTKPLSDSVAVAQFAPASGAASSIIESIGVHLPPRAVPTSEVLRGCQGVISPALERVTGIRSRRMAGQDEFSIDLAKRAIERCLAISKYHPSDVDLLICCNISRCNGPNYRYTFEPSMSITLKGHFGFTHALTFDLSNACAGMFAAIKLVDGLIAAGLIEVGLVVSGEYITNLLTTAQKEITEEADARLACLTLGDSGVALTLERAPDARVGFHAIDLYTAGKYSHYCVAKPTDQPHGGAIMVTDSAKLYDVASRHGAAHFLRTLQAVGWRREDLHHFISHQASQNGIRKLVRQINELARDQLLHPGNVVNNLAERGNTATTTHFVAVWDNILSDKIRTGDHAAFAVEASGLTIGTAPYTFDDLPDRVRGAVLSGDGIRPGARRSPRQRPVRPTLPRVRIESLGVAAASPGAERDSISLVEMAADQCFPRSSYGRGDVRLLIYTGVHRTDFICEPAIATIVAGRLRLNEGGITAGGMRTFAFDIFNSSIGFLNACCVAAGLIAARAFEPVMVVASEIENNRGLPGATLRGIAEAGSAVILDRSPDGRTGFGRFVFRSFSDHLGAFSSWVVQQDGITSLRFARTGDLESIYLDCIPPAVDELLRLEGLSREDVTIVLPPQLSPTFVPRLSEALNVPKDRFVDIAEDGKEPFSSTLPCTFQHAVEKRGPQRDDVGLIINVGSGVQVGCAIYYF